MKRLIYDVLEAREFLSNLISQVETASDLVFFGGAGVSTASGIPDFRGSGGLYATQDAYADKNYSAYPAEYLLSHSCLVNEPQYFYEFYIDSVVYPEAKPNAAHYALAQLEDEGKLGALITQNIDGLHQKAGSKRVIELHGSCSNNYCMSCGKNYSQEEFLNLCTEPEAFESGSLEPELSFDDKISIPHCKSCSALLRPDIVLYEEALDQEKIIAALQAIEQARFLLVAGSSLSVYPAAGFIRYFRGERLVIINLDETGHDELADIIIRCPIAEVLDVEVVHHGSRKN